MRPDITTKDRHWAQCQSLALMGEPIALGKTVSIGSLFQTAAGTYSAGPALDPAIFDGGSPACPTGSDDAAYDQMVAATRSGHAQL